MEFLKSTVDRCAQKTIDLQTPNNYDIKVMQINNTAKDKKADIDIAYSNAIQKK